MEVAGERTKVVSGGNCPKYDDVAGGGRQLPKDAPNPYRERAELLGGELERVVVEAKKLGLGLDEVQAGLAAHWKKLGGK